MFPLAARMTGDCDEEQSDPAIKNPEKIYSTLVPN
jgi:hypothetical protein